MNRSSGSILVLGISGCFSGDFTGDLGGCTGGFIVMEPVEHAPQLLSYGLGLL